MGAHSLGLLEVPSSRDDTGATTYRPQWLVYVDDPYNELAATVYNCPDLPKVGDHWAYGSEIDQYSWCHPNWTVDQVLSGEPGKYWKVTTPFSTKGGSRCQDTQVQNPLQEPPNISGSFIKLTRFALEDIDQRPLMNSAFEELPDSFREVDDNRPTVVIQMNILQLPLATFVPMVDAVNSVDMWGLSAKMVKLSNVSWERKVYGKCTYYFSVTYEFEVNKDTWVRRIPDYGSMVYSGNGDRNDPANYVPRRNQFLTEDLESGLLNGNGDRLTTNVPVILEFNVYPQVDFFALGIPATFN